MGKQERTEKALTVARRPLEMNLNMGILELWSKAGFP